MQEFLIGIILLFIGGVTTLAYKHPKSYEAVETVLFYILVVIFFITITWNAAVSITVSMVGEIENFNYSSELWKVRDRLEISYIYQMGGYIISIVYLKLLLYIHLLKDDKRV